jgi:ribosomal protein S18 acetylase RimI-like enzyme
MTHDISIRAATIDDAESISQLVTRLALEYIACELAAEGANRLLNSLSGESIRSYLKAGYKYYVAESGSVLAGVVATRDNRHLYHLFVAQPFQRRGLARRLWQVAQAPCLAAGTREFTVNSSRSAVAVYERFGFTRQSESQDAGGVVSVPMKLTIG